MGPALLVTRPDAARRGRASALLGMGAMTTARRLPLVAILLGGAVVGALLALVGAPLLVPLLGMVFALLWQQRRTAPDRERGRRSLRLDLAGSAALLGFFAARAGLRDDVLHLLPVVVGILVGAGALVGAWRPGGRALRRLRQDRPGAVVVRAVLADDGSLRLAQWARAARVELPAMIGPGLLLASSEQGLELWIERSPARRLALVPWDDVTLERRPSPDDREGWWAVLTLRGPEPSAHARQVPRPRSAHPVSVLLYRGSLPAVRAEAVDALVAQLLAPSPARPVDAVGDVG